MNFIVIGTIDKLNRPDGTQKEVSVRLHSMSCEREGIGYRHGLVQLGGIPVQDAAYCKVGDVAFVVVDDAKRQFLRSVYYGKKDGAIYAAVKSVVAQFLAEHPDVLPDMFRKQHEARLQAFVSGKLDAVQSLLAS